jgi:hypothetical protein
MTPSGVPRGPWELRSAVSASSWTTGRAGAVIRVFSDGRLRNTVVGTASPYGQGSSSGYGISITPRHGARVRDLTSHILMSAATQRAEREDRRVWRTLGSSYDGVLVKSDAPVMAYRRWYAGWAKSSPATQLQTAENASGPPTAGPSDRVGRAGHGADSAG